MKKFYYCLAAGSILFSLHSHFSALDWGTPSKQRTLAIFKDNEELEAFIPRMIELRQNFYKSVNALMDPQQPFKQNYQQAYNRHDQTVAFAELSQDSVLDQTRGFLLGVMNSDEQSTLIALTQLRSIFKTGFTPSLQTFVYGGVYFALCGTVLQVSHWLHIAHLTPDVAYYMRNPQDVRKLYVLIRGIGPVMLILATIVLFLLLKNQTNPLIAWLSVSFYLFQPGWIFYDHSMKPHVLVAAMLIIGLYWCNEILKDPRRKNYLLAGFFFGMCAGSLIVNIPTITILIFTEILRLKTKWKDWFKNPSLWYGVAVFASVYLTTNFHFLLHFDRLKRLLMAWEEFGTGFGHPFFFSIPLYIRDIWTMQISWPFLPLIATGIVVTCKSKDQFGLLCLGSWAILFLLDITLTKHWGVNLRTVAFYAVFIAIALRFLLQSKRKLIQVFSLGYIAIALFFSITQSEFCSSVLRSPMIIEEPSAWITNNIPKQSSIGILNGTFGPASMPPYHFLDYKLVNFPKKEPSQKWEPTELPRYVILGNEPSNEFMESVIKKFYSLKAHWPRRKAFFGLNFRLTWDNAGPVYIYEKT